MKTPVDKYFRPKRKWLICTQAYRSVTYLNKGSIALGMGIWRQRGILEEVASAINDEKATWNPLCCREPPNMLRV